MPKILPRSQVERGNGASAVLPVNAVRTDIQRHDEIAFNVEDGSQIGFDLNRINRPPIAGGELVNLVRSQTRIEWILLENAERASTALLLLERELAKVSPERPGSAEAILH